MVLYFEFIFKCKAGFRIYAYTYINVMEITK